MKYFINKVLKTAGYQIKKYPDEDLRRRLLLIKKCGITLLFDIGANKGQYASQVREEGYSNRIVSFEPLRDAFSKLESVSLRSENWLAVNYAIGDTNGKGKINISANSYSSSMNSILKNHLEADPSSGYIGEQEIEVKTLDSIFFDYYIDGDTVMLKIDTQGHEEHVIRGASGVLNRIKLIQIEMALTPLYDGQILYGEMISLMKSKGFNLVSLENGFYMPSTGKLLQVDGIFMRD